MLICLCGWLSWLWLYCGVLCTILSCAFVVGSVVWVLCVVRCHCFNVSCSAAVAGVAVAWLVAGGVWCVFTCSRGGSFWNSFLGFWGDGAWVGLKP